MSAAHWDRIFAETQPETLGWYQSKPQPDLDLIKSLNLPTSARILLAGVGSSTLVDHLYEVGYHNLILVDHSATALNSLQERINAPSFEWILDDLSQPRELLDLDPVDLWVDRAVLHFFLEERQRQAYHDLLLSRIRPGGHLLMAQFSTSGASRCSGLDVRQYDPSLLQNFVGDQFHPVRFMDYTYTQPSGGKRPFIYGVFQFQP